MFMLNKLFESESESESLIVYCFKQIFLRKMLH